MNPDRSETEQDYRLGRIRLLDEQRVNLDGFAQADPELGMISHLSPHDPEPSWKVADDGSVLEMDSKAAADFDTIDEFIVRYAVDPVQAPQSMAMSEIDLARMIVDSAVPREEVLRVCGGLTPAKMARVVAMLQPVEIQMAMMKMRARRTPANQAHVTNRLDDPLLIAADAATAVVYGFRELEATVPVLDDAPAVAVGLLIGSQVPAPGALTQCSVEEARELELGVRGLVSYAETVSVYGTEQVFTDGDDTPWSKAFLTSSYASRGIKMRLSSGAGSEVLMGQAERKSMNYLESRCVALAKGIGAQGVQNGGIDGASITASVPGGVRELIAENLMVMLRGLESCSGNDSLVSESTMRRTSRTLPVLLSGSDFIFSGFGSVVAYDNMFGPSNFNAADLDDYLVMQRDWGVDGGLRSVDPTTLEAMRRQAAEATRAVFEYLGLADFDDEHVEAVVGAEGSKDLPDTDGVKVLSAARMIEQSGLTVLDIVAALAETGFTDIAERVLGMAKARVTGDYLQTAAIFDEQMNVLSALQDPNDYRGPGTGYRPTAERQAQIDAVRQARSVTDLVKEQATFADPDRLVMRGPAGVGDDPREVVIGVSPAFGVKLFRTLSGMVVYDALEQILAGLEEEQCVPRLVRIADSVDLGVIGKSAARLSGSGIGVGLQAKGTTLIHRRDLPPLANLELLSVAPLITPEMYRLIGINAGRHAKGATPAPMRNAYTDEAITARYHTRVVSMVAIERSECDRDDRGVNMELELKR
ncbi:MULTISPECIES: propanediol/glycerol family dehydratase large subunit [Mycolicibacterium]|uniref:Propanediol dehydratase medium subunit n=1 Tax=Mycolicibacterium senegalense TaxID=1796 RepID=A0A378W2Y7_9MYCO|nr:MULTISPECIES: propanediol/glycerol family dehydratase large subunit [Mycolicibacterium]MCV7335870.1 propanediol/glycerol family dehydratase large subunit [Mycolicibacterium senegalense]MDR7288934.1 propanediol dehydratase large subunit [Mycolicibacterium senegalense]QZA25828.1 propanediol/glycerol family dehydratase large subunit [Mycolicibacterium senegalense]CDP84834.1 glycerol dehydratase large subunit [Mycolicibacterium farcinogenes]SUA27493.1 propanediol dehydratase medium subunit [Myc